MCNQDRIRVPRIIAVIAFFGLLLPAVIVADDSKSDFPDERENYRRLTEGALPYVPHQLVVRSQLTSATMDYLGLEAVRSTTQALANSPVYLVDIDPEADVQAVAQQISAMPSVVFAHPNYLLSRSFPIQGSYPFPDQNVSGDMDGQYASELLGLAGAHVVANGTGVTVGVIDCGVDFAHPSLGGKAVSGWDFVESDAIAFDEPDGKISGHGTFVAGIVHLTAPNATIKSYRVMNQNGYGDGFTLAQAIERAVDEGCNIINLSVALTHRHLAVRDAIDYAVSKGVTVVAGAGNDGGLSAVYPAAEASAIAVAAVDSTLRVTTFSNVGAGIDICAPGADIYSAYVSSGFAWWSGTSFSTPFVSGLAALLKEQDPGANWLTIRQRVIAGALNLDLLNPAMAGKLGNGLLNPPASLSDTIVPTSSAVFIPDTLSFTHYVGQMYILPPTVVGQLMSTFGPAPWVWEIADSGAGQFAWALDDSANCCGDSIKILLEPDRFTEGVYYNTLAFHVSGISEPAYATVRLTVVAANPVEPYAWLSPPDVYVSAPHAQTSMVIGTSLLRSTNAPAPFTAAQRPGPTHVVNIQDQSGYTDDSVRFSFTPASFFSPGMYDDTIFYSVAGVLDPVPLAIHLSITQDTIQGDSALFIPTNSVYSLAPADSTYGAIVILSSNMPATYSASVSQTVPFVHLIRDSGTTPDSILFVVRAGDLAPGTYYANLYASVVGVENNPIHSAITLIVNGPGGPDSGWVLPSTKQFQAPGGIPNPSQGSFSVAASGSSKWYRASYWDTPDFVQLIDTVGFTPGTVNFNIVPVHTYPGIYEDIIDITMEGVFNNPIRFFAYLEIDSSGVGTVTVIPDTMELSLPASSHDTIHRQVFLSSSGGSVPYVALVDGGIPPFLFLRDSTGMTNDSVDVYARLPFPVPAGSYYSWVLFYVSGVPGFTPLRVKLTVTGPSDSIAGSASEELVELSNYPNPFNPRTTVLFTLPAAGNVTLEIFDVLGRRVRTLVDGWTSIGDHSIPWDGTDSDGLQVSSGIYFYRLTTETQSLSKKMLLLK